MTATVTREAGTVKIGRWVYPARREGDEVFRAEKRDGSGDWLETNPLLFTLIGEGDPSAEKIALAEFGGGTAEAEVGMSVDDARQLIDSIDGFTEADPKVTHGGKAGAQSRKPGKSAWEVGGECPQGHTLEEGDIYVMPSGRKQCRKCRRGYGSNKSTSK